MGGGRPERTGRCALRPRCGHGEGADSSPGAGGRGRAVHRGCRPSTVQTCGPAARPCSPGRARARVRATPDAPRTSCCWAPMSVSPVAAGGESTAEPRRSRRRSAPATSKRDRAQHIDRHPRPPAVGQQRGGVHQHGLDAVRIEPLPQPAAADQRHERREVPAAAREQVVRCSSHCAPPPGATPARSSKFPQPLRDALRGTSTRRETPARRPMCSTWVFDMESTRSEEAVTRTHSSSISTRVASSASSGVCRVRDRSLPTS